MEGVSVGIPFILIFHDLSLSAYRVNVIVIA